MRNAYATGIVIDGSVVVQMLSPKTAKTFDEYSKRRTSNYLVSKVKDKITSIDIIFHVYKEKSIKAEARESRGTGMRIKFTSHTSICKKWKEFLHHNQNKADLFLLLAKDLIIIPSSTVRIVCTVNNDVLSNDQSISTEFISRCDHEEADTRIVLHVKHQSDEVHKVVCVQSVDRDVVVIVTASFSKLNIQELWLEYGTGKYKKILPIHAFANVDKGEM